MTTITGLTLEDLIEPMRIAKKHFLKHLNGLKEEQWRWKPYPECKNVIETLQHLIVDERAALESLRTGAEPNYETHVIEETNTDRLLSLLDEAHDAVITYLKENYANKPLDTEVCIFGSNSKLGVGLPYISSEYYYHAGQVSYIRMATDPSWDYYTAIYG